MKVYECKVGMTTEKYETREMKEKLSEFFLQRDLAGAKEYFLGVLEKRPDVLMEASDITGELKLSMQVIAVCTLEKQEYGESVLDKIQQFDDLIHYFTRLNEIISDYSLKQVNDGDVRFLKENQVTDIAIEASARLFITDEAELNNVVEGVKGLLQK